MEERQWIRKEACLKYGKTLKFEVIDVDKVVDRIRQERVAAGLTTLINIVPVFVDQYKKPNRSFTYQKDPITAVYYGILLKEDQYGALVWSRVTISDGLPLDINRTDEARIWAVIRFNPNIKGSPFQTDNPFYKVDDPTENAMIEITRAETLKKAFDKIDLIIKNPRDMVYFARYLGHDVHESSNMNVVKSILYKAAQLAPLEFITKWDSKQRSAYEIFHSAVALSVIMNYPDRGYVYKSIPLGADRDSVVAYLQKDPQMLTVLNREIIDADKVVEKIENEIRGDKEDKYSEFK